MQIAAEGEPVQAGSNPRAPRQLRLGCQRNHQANPRNPGPGDRLTNRRHFAFSFACLILWLAVGLLLSACSSSIGSATVAPTAREGRLRQIAADYAASRDLGAAQAALDKLELANPAQLVLTVAESDLSAGRPKQEIEQLAALAEALGARSPKLIAVLAPTPKPLPTKAPPTATPTVAPSPTAVPPSPTTAPTATETAVQATEPPPKGEPTQAAPSATPESQTPRVVAENDVNLRSGPGRAYPVIGRLRAGQEVNITGRNASGDWWQIKWSGHTQAWVAGTVVRVLGAIDTVAQVKNIPTPPPAPTAAPKPTAAPVAPSGPVQTGGPDFRLQHVRLWAVQENGGFYDGSSVHCGEKRELHVVVLDAAGNPLNGVTVKVVYGNQEEAVTGAKGPGEVEFVLGLGQDAYVIRDVDGRQVTSEYARGMSTNPAAISPDVLTGAGYCRDAADCAHFVSQNGCYQHFSWTATFRRAY